MPPRHVYWTILVGDAPTAFRAHDRADLLPTFERLRKKHPDVVLKYFARGRLWASAEDARSASAPPRPSEPRGRDWRPGGTHRDPRDRFKKAPRTDRPSPNRSSERSARPPYKPPPSGPRSAWRDERAAKPRGTDRPWKPKPTQGDRPRSDTWRSRDNHAPRSDRAPREDRRPGDKWQPPSEWRDRQAEKPKPKLGPATDRPTPARQPKETRGPWRDPAAKGDRGPTPGSTSRPWKPKTFTPGRNRESKWPVGPIKVRPSPDRPPDDRPKNPPDERVEAGRKEGTRLVKKVKR